MAKVQTVVLLGKSVVASSLASILRGRPEVEVVQLGAAVPETLLRLRDAHPDAIILCEPAKTSPDLIFLLLREHPCIPVIRADIDGDRMVVLSGRQASLRTEEDLLEAIGPRRAPACHPRAKRRSQASPTAGNPAVGSPIEEGQ